MGKKDQSKSNDILIQHLGGNFYVALLNPNSKMTSEAFHENVKQIAEDRKQDVIKLDSELGLITEVDFFRAALAKAWLENPLKAIVEKNASDSSSSYVFYDIPKFLDKVFISNPFHSLRISTGIFNKINNSPEFKDANVVKKQWKQFNEDSHKEFGVSKYSEISMYLVKIVSAIVSSPEGAKQFQELADASSKFKKDELETMVNKFATLQEYDQKMQESTAWLPLVTTPVVETPVVSNEVVAPAVIASVVETNVELTTLGNVVSAE
jgi:hypothetical protein